jgi:hypothetical protein
MKLINEISKFTCALSLALSCLLAPSLVHANEFDLSKQCQQVNLQDAKIQHSVCYQYIAGFLDGAVLTDSTIMLGLSKYPEMSVFSERAIQTRLGKYRAPLPDTYLADFCLPEQTDRQTVISELISLWQSGESKSGNSAKIIYSLIKQAYPCPEDLDQK